MLNDCGPLPHRLEVVCGHFWTILDSLELNWVFGTVLDNWNFTGNSLSELCVELDWNFWNYLGFLRLIYRQWLELQNVFLGYVDGVTRSWVETLAIALENADRLQSVTISAWSCVYFWMGIFEQHWTLWNSTEVVGTVLDHLNFTGNSESKLWVELDWDYLWFLCCSG